MLTQLPLITAKGIMLLGIMCGLIALALAAERKLKKYMENTNDE